MPGKKKKSSSSKKNKSSSRKNNGASNNGNRKKAIPLEDVLTQAESAMEMSDVNTALQLFTYAAGILHTRVHDTTNTPSPTTTAAAADNISNNIDQDKSTLSTVLGKIGELKASNGDVDGARSDFLNAIELLGPSATSTTSNGNINTDIQTAQNFESRANLHLYLGQLSMGIEALDSLKVGVTELEFAVGILERICCAKTEEEDDDVDMDDVNSKRFLAETRRQLCAAHCSIAELYLTDLCEEPDAESLCESSLKSALALDGASSSSISNGKDEESAEVCPPSPDALQTMANFRLSQSRVQEALECILKAYDRMKVGCEAMSALVGLGNNNKNNGKAESASSEVEVEEDTNARELVNVDAASSLPEYNFRVQTAKILLECASSLVEDDNNDDTMMMKINQCAESAIQVLGSLMAENDEIIEVWYLLGCAFVTCTPANVDSATYYWNHAHEMLIKVKSGLEEAIDDDDDNDEAENELEAIECQIKEVETKLEKYNVSGDSEGDDEMKDS